MSEVAKMLGVELGERFKIVNNQTGSLISEYDYCFSDKDIMICQDGRGCSGEYILIHLIHGTYTIKRKPWKPSLDEQYYYVDELGHPCSDPWVNSVLDITLYRVGNCYRTKEEAEANRDKWQSFCTSDEVLEV
jgi:hypothetical protein